MSSFKHLQKYEATGTAPYSLSQLEGDPELILAPALSSNKPYFNGLLKRSRKNARKIQAMQFDEQFINDNRADDKILYSRHCITDWSGIKDDSGEEVTFSSEEAYAFLTELPDWIFDDIRAFCREPQNFVEDPVPDGKATSENLPSG